MDLSKWQKTVEVLAELYGAAAASIVELRGDHFEVVCTSGGGENCLDQACVAFSSDINSYCRRVMETDALLYVASGDTDPEWRNEFPVTRGNVISYLGFPIRRPDNSFFGSICVKHDESTNYSDVFVRALEQFRDLVEADLALVARARELEELAATDGATGCANRRGLRAFLENQLPAGEQGLGVLYFDLDNLKATNDRFGHASGDAGIRLLARVLRETAREEDIAARVGGDEFVLVARVPHREALAALRDRIVEAFEEGRAQVPELALLGLSVGAVFLDTDHPPLDFDALLTDADASMYMDKKARKMARA